MVTEVADLGMTLGVTSGMLVVPEGPLVISIGRYKCKISLRSSGGVVQVEFVGASSL